MERSGMLVLPLLGLFGALVVLPPDVSGQLNDRPNNDSIVQGVLTVAMKQYNYRSNSTHYFKVLRLRKAEHQVDVVHQEHLLVELVETRCKKKAGSTMLFKHIQKCLPLPGKPKELICYFQIVYNYFPAWPMTLAVKLCG